MTPTSARPLQGVRGIAVSCRSVERVRLELLDLSVARKADVLPGTFLERNLIGISDREEREASKDV